jgi:oxygen-independent coproporphyrinogen-3 oxidase
VVLSPEGLRVTPVGRLLIRRICMTFDAYIKKSGSEIRYSKII